MIHNTWTKRFSHDAMVDYFREVIDPHDLAHAVKHGHGEYTPLEKALAHNYIKLAKQLKKKENDSRRKN